VESLWIAMIAGVLILVASMASVEAGISVALIEITLGVVAGNFLGLTSPPWMDFLASFASILLTFLAGAEVDHQVLRERFKESVLIGGVSFLAPFIGAWLVCAWALGWSTPAAQIAGVALIMASTFVTDFGVALTLAVLFIRPTWWLVPFLGVSVLIIAVMIALQPWFFRRYGDRVIEPEIKGAVAALLVMMFFAERAQSHAVLPAFVLGLALAPVFSQNHQLGQRFRVVAFALLTPFFFLKGGLNVSLGLVWANIGLLALLLAVKQATKILGVYPLAIRYVPKHAMFMTLLMSTGLTFGTISSLYGLNAGILSRAQFSVLVTVVVASAVVPTLIAQRWFSPETRPERRVAVEQ
jgi:Kef-type K+ transport system membrane component KefB